MTQRQVKLIENYVRKQVRSNLAKKNRLTEGSYSAMPSEVVGEVISKLDALYRAINEQDKNFSGLATEFNLVKRQLKQLSGKLPKEEIWIYD